MASKNSRTTSEKERKVLVNLGSGTALLEGFVNVDNFVGEVPYSGNHGTSFKKGDLRALPFEKESVDYILSNNVLEHLPMADVPIALYEMRRVLKTGGRAVIIVPDFSWLAHMWLEMEQQRFHAIAHRWLAEEIYGNQFHEGEYHRAPMSPGYLNYVLQMCGFLNYTLTKYSANAEIPTEIPGIIKKGLHDRFRNDMIIADIIK